MNIIPDPDANVKKASEAFLILYPQIKLRIFCGGYPTRFDAGKDDIVHVWPKFDSKRYREIKCWTRKYTWDYPPPSD